MVLDGELLDDVEYGYQREVVAHAVAVDLDKEEGVVEVVYECNGERAGDDCDDITFAVPHDGDIPIPEPPSYWVLAWLSLLLCFPIGLCAISTSRKVGKLYRAGDEVGALRMSLLTQMLSIMGCSAFVFSLIAFI